MKITNPEFFFTNYVGYTPDEEKKFYDTRDMIGHYIDSGMEGFLPSIYEACAKDECLTAHNIPKHLWKQGNFLEDGAFYMHPALTIMSQKPQYDSVTGKFIEYPYYRENLEFFSMDDVLRFAYEHLPSSMIRSEDKDAGTVKYMLKKYADLRKQDIQPLDMVLFLISTNDGGITKLIDCMNEEDRVLEMIICYRNRLRDHDRFHVTWRGELDA